MTYTVKSVAEAAGISVRTLHHYDEIGLLKPAMVSEAGYRLYAEPDLERLQQILFFRELGFALQEIRAILDSPSFDRKQALLSHRELLLEKQKRLDTLIRSLDRSIESMERGLPMDKNELFEGFDEAQQAKYREEAAARWGREHVDESYRRTANYTKADWARLQDEMQAIGAEMAAGMDRGDPGAPEVQAAVEHWHRFINEKFYDCSLEVFRGLGDLYVDDARFTATYEKIRPGLAPFLRQAMHEYCDRREAKA